MNSVVKFCKTGSKNFILLYKNKGKFYRAYYEDANILCFIFGYKIIDGKYCGFPDTAINKVINKLEDLKISYEIVYINQNPISRKIKGANNYEKYKEIALKILSKEERINMIVEKIKRASSKDFDKVMEAIEKCLG